MGYDACGGEPDKTVISVPPFALPLPTPPQVLRRAAKTMTEAAKAMTKQPVIETMIGTVSKESLMSINNKLAQYNSRNSHPDSNLFEALAWVESQLQSYGFVVTRDQFTATSISAKPLTQLYTELPGTKEPSKIIVLGAHMDD